MKGDFHVRFRENLRVKLPWVTRLAIISMSMEQVINFIKDFRLSSYGLEIWDMWLIFGILIITFALGNWIISSSAKLRASGLKRWLTFSFYTIFYGVMTFMILNSILTNNYGRLTVLIFSTIIPYLGKWIDNFYKRYDNLVDKVVDKK
jgi:hypothetical protein